MGYSSWGRKSETRLSTAAAAWVELVKRWSNELRVGLNPMTGVLIRGDTQKRRSWKDRHKPRNSRNHQKLKEAKKHSPLEPSEEYGPENTLTLDFKPSEAGENEQWEALHRVCLSATPWTECLSFLASVWGPSQ